MNRDHALLAVEDALSASLGRRLLAEASMEIYQIIGLKGNSYLRRKAPALNQTAKGLPVLLLTDLDTPANCPPQLIQDWLGAPQQAGLMFRVAVLEAESWVMADISGFSQFLGIAASSIPQPVEEIAHPKESLVGLARTSRSRSIRDDLVPSSGSTARVGPAYNPRLTDFVRSRWDPDRAAETSPSLARALAAIRSFR